MNTMPAEVRARVERATVRLAGRRGLGVLVPDGVIVTAAHLLERKPIRGRRGGWSDCVMIEAGRAMFRAGVRAIDTKLNIAVLTGPDGYDAAAFANFCDSTVPVSLYTDDIPHDEKTRLYGIPDDATSIEIAGHVLTHNNGWLGAHVQHIGREDSPFHFVTTAVPVDGGTSGGPVIADDGRLLGVISYLDRGRNDFTITRVHLAAPVCFVDWMRSRVYKKGA
jgi:hypothetical protein